MTTQHNAQAQAEQSYKTPPASIKAIVDTIATTRNVTLYR